MRKKNQPGCPCCRDCEVIRACLEALLSGTTATRQLLLTDLPTAMAVNGDLEDCNSDPVNCSGCSGPFAANVYVDHYSTATIISTDVGSPYTAECVHFYRDTAVTAPLPCDFANMIELCNWCNGAGTTTAYLGYEVEIWPLPLQEPAPTSLTSVRIIIKMGYWLDSGGFGCADITPVATWQKTIAFGGTAWEDFCAGEDVEVPLLSYLADGSFEDTGPCNFTSAPGPITIALQPAS